MACCRWRWWWWVVVVIVVMRVVLTTGDEVVLKRNIGYKEDLLRSDIEANGDETGDVGGDICLPPQSPVIITSTKVVWTPEVVTVVEVDVTSTHFTIPAVTMLPNGDIVNVITITNPQVQTLTTFITSTVMRSITLPITRTEMVVNTNLITKTDIEVERDYFTKTQLNTITTTTTLTTTRYNPLTWREDSPSCQSVTTVTKSITPVTSPVTPHSAVTTKYHTAWMTSTWAATKPSIVTLQVTERKAPGEPTCGKVNEGEDAGLPETDEGDRDRYFQANQGVKVPVEGEDGENDSLTPLGNHLQDISPGEYEGEGRYTETQRGEGERGEKTGHEIDSKAGRLPGESDTSEGEALSLATYSEGGTGEHANEAEDGGIPGEYAGEGGENEYGNKGEPLTFKERLKRKKLRAVLYYVEKILERAMFIEYILLKPYEVKEEEEEEEGGGEEGETFLQSMRRSLRNAIQSKFERIYEIGLRKSNWLIELLRTKNEAPE